MKPKNIEDNVIDLGYNVNHIKNFHTVSLSTRLFLRTCHFILNGGRLVTRSLIS